MAEPTEERQYTSLGEVLGSRNLPSDWQKFQVWLRKTFYEDDDLRFAKAWSEMDSTKKNEYYQMWADNSKPQVGFAESGASSPTGGTETRDVSGAVQRLAGLWGVTEQEVLSIFGDDTESLWATYTQLVGDRAFADLPDDDAQSAATAEDKRRWDQQIGMQQAQNATDLQISRNEMNTAASNQWFADMATKFQQLPSQVAQQKQRDFEEWRQILLDEYSANPEENWIKIAQVQAKENPYQYDPASMNAWDKQYVDTVINGGYNPYSEAEMTGLKPEATALKAKIDVANEYDDARTSSWVAPAAMEALESIGGADTSMWETMPELQLGSQVSPQGFVDDKITEQQSLIDRLERESGNVARGSNDPALIKELSQNIKQAKDYLKQLESMAEDPYSAVNYSDPKWNTAYQQAEKYISDMEKYQADLVEFNTHNLPWYSLTQMKYWDDLTPEQQQQAAMSTMPKQQDKNILDVPAWLDPFLKKDTINLKNMEKAAPLSAQAWYNLSPSQQRGFAGYLKSSGGDINDYLNQMSAALPTGNISKRNWSRSF